MCLDRLVEISTGAELGWAEGMGLCEEFWLGATHSSRVYSHEWRPGDLVLIDNIPVVCIYRYHLPKQSKHSSQNNQTSGKNTAKSSYIQLYPAISSYIQL